MVSRPDDPERPLTEAEAADRNGLGPALSAAKVYIGLTSRSPAGRLAEAEQQCLPLAPLRRTPGSDDDLEMGIRELYVNPTNAHAYLSRIRPATVRHVNVARLTDAFEFMGARRAVTMRGCDEVDRPNPWRDRAGWLRLSAAMVHRLAVGVFVPSLRGLRGGEVRTEPRSGALRSRIAAARLSPDTASGIVRIMLREATPTGLVAVALERGVPLVPRRRGRQPRGGAYAVDTAILHVPAVHRFIAERGLDHGVTGLATVRATAVLLGTVAEQQPDRFTLVHHVRGADRPDSIRSQTGWLRCDLAALGLPAANAQGLRDEFIGWRDAQVAAELEADPRGAATYTTKES